MTQLAHEAHSFFFNNFVLSTWRGHERKNNDFFMLLIMYRLDYFLVIFEYINRDLFMSALSREESDDTEKGGSN